MLFPCAEGTAQTIIPFHNVFIYFNFFDSFIFLPLYLNEKIEGQIIPWGNSAGLTLIIAVPMQFPIRSHFSLYPHLILLVPIIEISLDPWVTGTLFFLFPDSPWHQWELWGHTNKPNLLFVDSLQRMNFTEIQFRSKNLHWRIVNLCPLISSLERPVITALRCIGENTTKQRKRSKAERDLLHLGFWGEQLAFTELFFSSLIGAVPGQNKPFKKVRAILPGCISYGAIIIPYSLLRAMQVILSAGF